MNVLLNNGDGTFAPKILYPAGTSAASITAADLNGDGKPDLAVLGFSSGLSVLLNNGNGTFAPELRYPTLGGLPPSGIAAADLNADGKLDLAIGKSSVTVMLNGCLP